MSGRGFVDYSENENRYTDTQTHRGSYRVRPGLKKMNSLRPYVSEMITQLCK